MKQKDLATILVVGFLSAIVSFVISGKLVPSASHQLQVETVAPISTEFSKPDSKYFNPQALDPTKLIQISNNSNQTPFNTQSGH